MSKEKIRTPKKRVIYDNYDLWDTYEEMAKEDLLENGVENPSDKDIWDEIYFLDEFTAEEEFDRMREFFKDGTWLLTGTVGRWNGRFDAGTVFTSFNDMHSKATTDCDYVSYYDENGHLYLDCSHHDGTNCFEIRKLTKKGEEFFKRNEDNYWPRELHEILKKRYSVLPHYAHNVFGCKKVEYETA